MYIEKNLSHGRKILSLRLFKAVFVVYALISVIFSIVSPQLAQAQYLPEPGSPLPQLTPGAAKQFYEPPRCKSGKGNPDSPTYLPPQNRGQSDPANTGSYCIHLGKTAEQRDGAKNTTNEPPCAQTYAEWVDNPHLDFWVEDPEVTSLGKGGERSREFLLWALTRQSIDDHPVILDTWKLSQNVALFLVLIIVIVMGIGIIIGQQGIGFMGSSFSFSVELTPLIIRIAVLLLYIIFSARIVLIVIQLSDVTMEFFIRTLGVRDLFNIYFIDSAGAGKGVISQLNESEKAYREFLGCTNWNINNQEMVSTSKAMVRFTNMTYYFIGGMLILRKVVLWFLIMVSPFLAILAPFIFVRNIGWIWIGVFFQWVFYGPLMALFLGGMANIWNSRPVHIPYIFDFSRVNDMAQVVYPTSINILYGGPAQKLGIFNTSNYVDTFAEYLISLIMLWTVLILPWWLLRIFRDYCCDGIYSMKNILLSMYDEMRTGGGPGPNPSGPTPQPTGTGKTALDLPTKDKTPMQSKIKLETVQDIKQAQTEQIVRSINMEAHSIKDIARMETNTIAQKQAAQNLNQLQNPFKAETATERQRIMNLRNEVQQRASQGDTLAQRIAAVTTHAGSQEHISKDKILQSMPQIASTPVVTRLSVSLPQQRQEAITQSALSYAARSQELVTALAQESNVSQQQVMTLLQAFNRISSFDTSGDDPIGKIAQEVGIEEQRVKMLLSRVAILMKSRPDMIDVIARQENVDRQSVQQAIEAQLYKAIGVTDQKSSDIVKRVLTSVSQDQQSVSTIAQQSHVTDQQAQQVLSSLGSNDQLDISMKDAVTETAAQTGLQPEQVRKVASQAAYVVKTSTTIVAPVAQDVQIEAETVKNIAQEKIEAVSKADKEIEDYVPQSQKVTIEEYEEVKTMWVQHYEKGEIPVTENIQTRQEWVDQDTVRISNILNKLLSPNKQLQEQGLTEVGYILPIFMINNLTGEELLVYLKAKVQAAKEVSKELRLEADIRKGMKSEEELVDIDRPKEQVAAKEQTLSASLDEPVGEPDKTEPDKTEDAEKTEPEGQTPAPDVNPAYEEEQKPSEDITNIQRTLEDQMK